MNPEDNDEGLIKHLIEEFRNYTLIDILRMIVNPDDDQLKDKEGKIPIKKSYPRYRMLKIIDQQFLYIFLLLLPGDLAARYISI